LTSVQMSAIGTTNLAALETRDVAALDTFIISKLSSTQLGALTTDQIVGLTADQALAISSASTAGLTTAQIAAFETRDLVALHSVTFKSLTSNQIGALTTAQVTNLGTAQLSAMDSVDLQGLTTSGMSALTGTQLAAFSSVQMSAFSTTQLSYIETADISSMTSVQLLGLDSTDIRALGATVNGSALSTATLDSLLAAQLTAMGSTQQNRLAVVTPMVLDLDGNGIQTVNVQNGVTFDIDNNGTLERTGWVARGDGLLVRDLNGDGVINNGGELFGSGTVLPDGSKAADGYAAMRALDTNLDGILDANDAAFGQLAVWADSDGDGITDAGELLKLTDLGITSLSLTSTASTEVNNGNLIGLLGSYTKSDGSTHTMGDVWFQVDTAGNKVFDLAAVAQAAGGANINLANAQAETLKVTLADVLAVGEADILSGQSSVTINGDASDTVQLAGTWSYAGTQQDGADTYMVYVNQNAQLLVNDKIHTIIG